jgi:hypothetical protein
MDDICLNSTLSSEVGVPVIPPFTYNNQCSSVLLTSYIPVLVIGYSIQLVALCVMPLLLSQAARVCSSSSSSKTIHRTIIHRKVTHGIVWPEFWMSNQSSLEMDPSMLLNSKSLLCFDILNNLMVMHTFGLCSPILAVAATCVAVSKTNMLILLVKRFVAVVSEVQAGSGSTQESDNSMFLVIGLLAEVNFPLREVLQRAFWLIAWLSAVFVAMMCWDVAGDAVGWDRSVWLPALALFYPALLWTVDFIVNKRAQDEGSVTKDIELASTLRLGLESGMSSSVSDNPLHM